MADPKHALSPGYILEGYRIERLIGGGGFSMVYVAYKVSNKAKVVVKEYCPEQLTIRIPGGRVVPISEEKLPAYLAGIRNFFREAHALAKVNHPNIVRVSNIFRTNNTVYMVMDYDEGYDLRWYIKRQGGRSSERLLNTVFPPLLRGLEAFHQQGLLHLDIKPANILLRRGGNPLLLDFGAVYQMSGDSQCPDAQVLTQGFAPIEQHERGQLGPWSDMYAVGATLYSCINGKPPPPAPERKIKDRVSLSGRPFSRYSRNLVRAIDWCLQMDYTQRPQSAAELLEACFTEPADQERITPRLNVGGLRWPWAKE